MTRTILDASDRKILLGCMTNKAMDILTRRIIKMK
jgi:hypothetical protein